MKKKILLFIGLLFALPLCVSAEDLDASVNVTCQHDVLKPESYTTCTLTATASKDVNVVEPILLEGTKLTISDVKLLDGWTIYDEEEEYSTDKKEYTVMATNKTAKKGNIQLATFKVTVDKNATPGKANVKASVHLAKIAKLSDLEESGIYDYNKIATKTFDITVPITDNTLKSISYMQGETKKSVAGISKDKFEYEITVPKTITSTRIFAEPTADLKQANVSGAGIPDGNGGKLVSLNYGLNTHKITVKNELGEAKTYTLKITREDPRVLKSLKVNDKDIELKENVFTYNLKVDYKVNKADVVALLEDETNAEFKDKLGSRDNIKLSVGLNEIQVVTYPKGEKESELVYKIVINRLDENGKDTTVKNTSTTKNPKTFGGQDLGIFGGIIVIVSIGYVLLRKKSKFPNA